MQNSRVQVQESFALKEDTIYVFFNIQAAFDKVWFNGLIFKCIKLLFPYNIFRTIIDYLRDRQFRVKVDDARSKYFNIETNFPKGRVLSPTLLSIYINDIPVASNRIEKEFSFLFADDINFIKSFTDLDKRSKLLKTT